MQVGFTSSVTGFLTNLVDVAIGAVVFFAYALVLPAIISLLYWIVSRKSVVGLFTKAYAISGSLVFLLGISMIWPALKTWFG